jgi:tRNA A37 N6-isopentenylltransferase MiaA
MPPTDRPRWPRDGRDGEKRSTRLHLVYGPTGSGKTGRATALARRTGAPVIVLDRIQCHPALAVGGGRPGEAEIAGTRRIYLCDRPVTAGELPPAEACRLLAAHVDELAANAPMVILEGGSVSVLKLMGRNPEWGRFTWSVDRRPLVPAEQYLPGAVKRARNMLQPPDGGAGLLEELAAAWAHPSARATLMSVFTYRVAVHAAQRAGLVVERATDLGDAARGELAQTLAVALHAHAQWQDREIPEPPAAWPRTAAPATDQPLTSGAQLL